MLRLRFHHHILDCPSSAIFPINACASSDHQGFTSRKTEMEDSKVAARRSTQHNEHAAGRVDSQDTVREDNGPAQMKQKDGARMV